MGAIKVANKILSYFKSYNCWVYFILVLCFLGLFRNIVFLSSFHPLGVDMETTFAAMIALYSAQIFFIAIKKWIVWVISLIQVIFCIYVYPDFSLLPFIAVIKYLFFEGIVQKGYGWANFINFAFVSLGFSAEILKTYLLYVYFPRKTSKN